MSLWGQPRQVEEWASHLLRRSASGFAAVTIAAALVVMASFEYLRVQEIRAGNFAFPKAPLVVANILAPVIVRLFNAGLAELIERESPADAFVEKHMVEGKEFTISLKKN